MEQGVPLQNEQITPLDTDWKQVSFSFVALNQSNSLTFNKETELRKKTKSCTLKSELWKIRQNITEQKKKWRVTRTCISTCIKVTKSDASQQFLLGVKPKLRSARVDADRRTSCCFIVKTESQTLSEVVSWSSLWRLHSHRSLLAGSPCWTHILGTFCALDKSPFPV